MSEGKEKVQRESWEDMFLKLKKFKEEHGHCDAPGHRDKLGRWAVRQRRLQKTGELKAERNQKLTELGFRFFIHHYTKPANVNTEKFDKNFSTMCGHVAEYSRKHGTGGWIPHVTKEVKGLGTWAKNRRTDKKLGRLSAERMEALEAVGFLWEKPRAGKENYKEPSSDNDGPDPLSDQELLV